MKIIIRHLSARRLCYALVGMMSFLANPAEAVELVIGEKRVKPGIVYIFEGAIKDQIIPQSLHLPENKTHIHIEARVNWDTKQIPKGAVAGGFIPYLRITAKIMNQKTGLSTFIDLLPHINLVDNFHYARNISLPGNISDPYQVVFTILPPTAYDLALHRDWVRVYDKSLTQKKVFAFRNVNFEQIVKARRR